AFFAAAFAYSDTTQGGMREAAVIFGELEMCLGLPRRVIWAKAQVFVELVGLKYFPRIHLPVWVPSLLEFAEGLHQFGAEHSGQKFGARLSVAVFAGERAAVADDKVCGFLNELAVLGDAFFRLQIEIEPSVHAGVAEVSVE